MSGRRRELNRIYGFIRSESYYALFLNSYLFMNSSRYCKLDKVQGLLGQV